MSAHYTPEEMALQDKVRERIKASGIDDLAFFQAAYYRAYMKFYNCVRDVMTFRVTSEVPEYVKAFVEEQQPT